MGLLTVIRKDKIKEKCIRTLVLGLDNAGKSTIVKRIIKEDVMEVSPTFGFEIKTTTYHEFKIDLWDVGGQKSIRPYWQNCFEQTDAVIWVIDSTDIERLETSCQELFRTMSQSRLVSIPLLIFANKQDLPTAATKEEIETFLSLSRLKKNKSFVSKVSAYLGKGIEEGLNWLVNEIKENR